jgi:broad specificity phosphatase PhoE
VAAYVAKFQREPRWTVAHELTKAGSKNARRSGRSLAALLRDYVFSDDKLAGFRWRSAVVALKGANQIRWSPGLRELLLPGTVEKTDEQLAEEQDDTAILLALLSLAEWRAVVGNDARAELLAVASSGDADAVRSFVAKLV